MPALLCFSPDLLLKFYCAVSLHNPHSKCISPEFITRRHLPPDPAYHFAAVYGGEKKRQIQIGKVRYDHLKKTLLYGFPECIINLGPPPSSSRVEYQCVTISVCEWVNCCGHIRNPLWEFFAVWTHDCISGPPRFSCYAVIGWFVYASIKGQLGRKRQTGISATALSVIQSFWDLTLLALNATQPQRCLIAFFVLFFFF